MATYQRIQFRRDTASEWFRVNPVLAVGEPGFETDTGKQKVGDGTTAWRALPYKNDTGPAGIPGPAGLTGSPGPVGPSGSKGDAGPAGPIGPTTVFSVGSVSSGLAAAASFSGTAPNQVLNLTLPKGDKGDTPSLAIGTVQTGASAAATITGTIQNPVLNLSIPQGPRGDTGPQGPAGAAGPKGDVGPAGPQGEVGPAGPQGPTGLKGDAGPTGPQGTKGETGAAAKIMGEATSWPPAASPSIGDLWIVDDPVPAGFPAGTAAGDGYVWTGTGWKNVGSIRGPKGDVGPKGDLGPTGPAGAAGPKGDTGVAGPKGDAGAAGTQGPAGPANTLIVGTVSSGDIPSASIRGTAPNQVLDLVLAKGAKGDTGLSGPTGAQGAAGPANTLRVGTVTTGKTPAVTITGTAPNQTLNMVLPEAAATNLSIGTVIAGSVASATLSGTAPNQVLNLVLPQAQVNHATSFYVSPYAQTIKEEEYATLTALASSTDAPLIYQWQFSDNPSDPNSWQDRPGAGSPQLTVLGKEEKTGRWFRCTCATPSGQAISAMAQLTVTPNPVNTTGLRQWSQVTLPDGPSNIFYNCQCLPKVNIESPKGVVNIGGYPFSGGNAQILQCNGRMFTLSHSSQDGINWTPYIGGPNVFQNYSEFGGGQYPYIDNIVYFKGADTYMMWCSMTTDTMRDILWGGALNPGNTGADGNYTTVTVTKPDGTTTEVPLNELTLSETRYHYRFWSRDGVSWEHTDEWSFNYQLTAGIRWEVEGCYVPSQDGNDMLWVTGQGGPVTFLYKASDPKTKTLVDSWTDTTAAAEAKDPFSNGGWKHPATFFRVNGVDAATFQRSRLWKSQTQGWMPPAKSYIGKSEITPALVPSFGLDNLGKPYYRTPLILGLQYGMVAGSMAYVAYASDGNFYYTKDPNSTAPLTKLERPPGITCSAMPVYGNGWWVIASPCDNQTYYTVRDLADKAWFTQDILQQAGWNFTWNSSMRRTPMRFANSLDPKLPGKFVMAGHYGEDDVFLRSLGIAE